MAAPANPLYFRRSIISVGTETTKGTSNFNATPFSGLTYGANIEPENLLPNTREPDGKYMGAILAVPGPRIGRCTFSHQLRHGDGYLTLLTGCGYVTGTPYVPTSVLSDQSCLSIRNWQAQDGGTNEATLKGIVGAMGTGTLTWDFDGLLTADWDFMGVWQAVTDGTEPALSPVTTVTNFTHASTFTLGASSAIPKAKRITINLNNTVSMRPDKTTANRVLHAWLSRGAPTVEIEFESQLVADWDAYGHHLAGTATALNLVITDGSNTLTITAPKMQPIQLRDSQNGPARMRTATYQCCASSGDDELTFVAA